MVAKKSERRIRRVPGVEIRIAKRGKDELQEVSRRD